METRNNLQLFRLDDKAFFYRLIDKERPASEVTKPDIAIYSYSITGKDLTLTQNKYSGHVFNEPDALTDWKLKNVEMEDCNPLKLRRLKRDWQLREMKIMEWGRRKKLVINGSEGHYNFRCDEVLEEVRGYSRKEIIEVLYERDEYLNESSSENLKLQEVVIRLSRFINREFIDYKYLMSSQTDSEGLTATKSKYYLEMLMRIKEKVDDLKKTLPERGSFT